MLLGEASYSNEEDAAERRDPAQALCNLVARRCGVTISKSDMEAMFLADWVKLTIFAHAIHHEQQRKISYAAQANGMKGPL